MQKGKYIRTQTHKDAISAASKGRRPFDSTRDKMSAAQKGNRNSMYAGGVTGCFERFGKSSRQYHQALHRWVVTIKGKANAYDCIDCGRQAHDWCNVNNHEYAQILEHYQPRCRKCHRAFDNPIVIDDIRQATLTSPHIDSH